MTAFFVRWLPLTLILITWFSASAQAEDITVMQPNDELAIFTRTITSKDKETRQVRLRLGYLLAPKVSNEIAQSQIITVKAAETLEFDKKDLKERRSPIFTAKDINARITKFALEKVKQAPTPKPQLVVQLVFVDDKGKVLERSKAAFLDFPAADAKADKDGNLSNDVTLTLGDVEAKATVAIKRAAK